MTFHSHSVVTGEGGKSGAWQHQLRLSIRRPTQDEFVTLLRAETGSDRSSFVELLCLFPAIQDYEAQLFRPSLISPSNVTRSILSLLAAVYLVLLSVPSWAVTGGSISGVLADQSDAVIPGATLKLVNIEQ